MESRAIAMSTAAWAEADRRAATTGASLGDVLAAALMDPGGSDRAWGEELGEAGRAVVRSGGPPGSDWAFLPDTVALGVFGRLGDDKWAKTSVRQVCRAWHGYLGAHTKELKLAERLSVTEGRTGRWRSLCPGAQSLCVALQSPRDFLCSVLVDIPAMEQLRSLTLRREQAHLNLDETRSFHQQGKAAREAMHALEELELEGLNEADLCSMFRSPSHVYPGSSTLPRLSDFSGLRRLSLLACEVGKQECLEVLGGMNWLEELRLVDVHTWHQAELNWLEPLANLAPSLKRLDFSCHKGIYPYDLAFISRLTNLEHLTLNGLQAEEDDGGPIFEGVSGDALADVLPCLQQLVSFESAVTLDHTDKLLQGLMPTDDMLGALVQLPRLERLALSGMMHETTPTVVAAAMRRMCGLKELRVTNEPYAFPGTTAPLISDDFLAALHPLSNLQTLELPLWDNCCSTEAVTNALKCMSSLVSLKLFYDFLSPDLLGDDLKLVEGWEEQVPVLDLSFVRETRQLRVLTMEEGTALVKNLADLRHAPGLEEVEVSGLWDNAIPAASVSTADLEALASLRFLSKLWLQCVDTTYRRWYDDGFLRNADEALISTWHAIKANWAMAGRMGLTRC